MVYSKDFMVVPPVNSVLFQSALDALKVVGVCEQHDHGVVVTGIGDGRAVEAQQPLPGLDLSALLHEGGEALALKSFFRFRQRAKLCSFNNLTYYL